MHGQSALLVQLPDAKEGVPTLPVPGQVISALAEGAGGAGGHVPFRDSQLTKLLMDSLAGSALTLMIACCSPAASAAEETVSTLTYSSRAKNIRNRPAVQVTPSHEKQELGKQGTRSWGNVACNFRAAETECSEPCDRALELEAGGPPTRWV